ncbi:hypothetical protein HPULCUR_011021 [Helicostylum pulchrum]|uniref:mitogen-activated protein kinase kinase n=1 Tax=Helicostylum pulchrum TaxID=562976 RepID=A0ABP9YEX5_9FUNG
MKGKKKHHGPIHLGTTSSDEERASYNRNPTTGSSRLNLSPHDIQLQEAGSSTSTRQFTQHRELLPTQSTTQYHQPASEQPAQGVIPGNGTPTSQGNSQLSSNQSLPLRPPKPSQYRQPASDQPAVSDQSDFSSDEQSAHGIITGNGAPTPPGNSRSSSNISLPPRPQKPFQYVPSVSGQSCATQQRTYSQPLSSIKNQPVLAIPERDIGQQRTDSQLPESIEYRRPVRIQRVPATNQRYATRQTNSGRGAPPELPRHHSSKSVGNQVVPDDRIPAATASINGQNSIALNFATTDGLPSARLRHRVDKKRIKKGRVPLQCAKGKGPFYRTVGNRANRIYVTRRVDTPTSLPSESKFYLACRVKTALKPMLDDGQLFFESPNKDWYLFGKIGSGANDVGTMQGFKAVLNEVQFMKSGHTNLVSLRYVFYEKEKVTIFMDKQECDLATMLYKYQYNVEEKVCNYITIEVLKGLSYLNTEFGYFHGDIKPENVLVGPNGEIKVADFGLCGHIGDNYHRPNGTQGYMAPEVLDSSKTFNESSDVWSLAMFMRVVYNYPGKDFNNNPHISTYTKCMISCMNDMDPAKRPTITQILEKYLDDLITGEYEFGTYLDVVAILDIIRDSEKHQSGFIAIHD